LHVTVRVTVRLKPDAAADLDEGRSREKESDMEMFLMGLCLSLLGVAVSALTFGVATRGQRAAEAQPAARKVAVPAAQFFVADEAKPAVAARVPVEILLAQLEQHVRLEQAAAESFLHLPTTDSLHTRTKSPLMN